MTFIVYDRVLGSRWPGLVLFPLPPYVYLLTPLHSSPHTWPTAKANSQASN